MSVERSMREALRLAHGSRGNTSPNPAVGAVVVDASGAVVGSGAHERAGADHAEVVALRQAGEKARGATLYVTLEPCLHHGRTPPCTEAIKAAGIARVVSALEDPDPRVKGAGHERLRALGMEVEVGAGAAQAAQINRMYLHHRRTGLPFVTLKMAQTLNGKIAARPGERRQLSGARAVKVVRAMRYEHDAVMVGAGTVVIDDPLLTVRPFKARAVPYTRIVVDARGRIPRTAKVLRDQKRFATIVATTDLMPAAVREDFEKMGVKVLICERSPEGGVQLEDLLRKLGTDGMLSILCEGGPTLAAALAAGKHVEEFAWLLAPRLLADMESVDVLKGTMDVALEIDSMKHVGEDWLVTAKRGE